MFARIGKGLISFAALVVLETVFVGCEAETGGTGLATQTGPRRGAGEVGGSSGAGGFSGTGGASSFGGSSGMGGASSVGGSSGTGGASSVGGSSGTGGASSVGGSSGTGGASSVGGSSGTGGASSVGGSSGTGGASSVGGSSGTGGASSVGGSTGCRANETCGIPVASLPPVDANTNPCNTTYKNASAGGWDVQANECWPTTWCEPSVPSSVSNGGVDATGKAILLRPVSAACGKGITVVTYAPGTLRVWGSNFQGSLWLGNNPSGYVPTWGPANASYTCVTNNVEVLINC